MPRPDRTKTQYGDLMHCPRCEKPVFVAVVSGWYVFYCPSCKLMHTHGQCRPVRTLLPVTPTNKGDSSNDNKKDNRSFPGFQHPSHG